jgi:DNA-binding CsgD family transcriptional regulator
MNTTSSTQSRVKTRRDRVKALALKGKSRAEISRELGTDYQTIRQDLKVLGIIPASTYKLKEKA